jgi:hypothetical protein
MAPLSVASEDAQSADDIWWWDGNTGECYRYERRRKAGDDFLLYNLP